MTLIANITNVYAHTDVSVAWRMAEGRGDNLQLFISTLLKHEEWLYNIIDDNNFEINSLEHPCTEGLKVPHTT